MHRDTLHQVTPWSDLAHVKKTSICLQVGDTSSLQHNGHASRPRWAAVSVYRRDLVRPGLRLVNCSDLRPVLCCRILRLTFNKTHPSDSHRYWTSTNRGGVSCLSGLHEMSRALIGFNQSWRRPFVPRNSSANKCLMYQNAFSCWTVYTPKPSINFSRVLDRSSSILMWMSSLTR